MVAKMRSFRVSDEEWSAWATYAAEHGQDMTTVIREAMASRIAGRAAGNEARAKLGQAERALKEIRDTAAAVLRAIDK